MPTSLLWVLPTLFPTACGLVNLPGVPTDQDDTTATPVSELRRVILTKVNAARSSEQVCGTKGTFAPAAELKEAYLNAAAKAYANDMHTQGYFSHTAPDGNTVRARVTRTGYRWSQVGEDITYGYKHADEVVTDWLESDGHCANLLNPSFTEPSVGRSGGYWVQVCKAALNLARHDSPVQTSSANSRCFLQPAPAETFQSG